MTKTLLRAGALSCALLASTALTAPAFAQELPRYNQVDANGVDLVTGQFSFSLPEGSIGSGAGALTLIRNWAGAAGWTDNWSGILYSDPAGNVVVEFGTYADTFTFSYPPLAYTSTKGDGATLEIVGDGMRYRSRDGTTIIFKLVDIDHDGAGFHGPACARAGGGECGIPVLMQRPDGMTYTLNWDFEPRYQGGWVVYPRFRGVSNSANYSFTINYLTNTPGSGTPVTNWFVRTGAQFTNLDGAPASLPTVTYSAVSSTVLDVTNIAGDTWRLTTGATAIGIRRPGSGSDDVSATLSSGLVTQVVRDGVTTGYSRSVSGSTVTTTVTQIDGDGGTTDPQTVIVADSSVGRITSVTDPLSRQTGFQYDGSGRLTRTTAPEGNYAAYSYDGRGNPTERRAVAKSGSGLPDMVVTASYDSSCSNVVTCNRPNSVTDARGNATDFTYDSTHGGVLTVTAPAPGGSGDRPQTRYSYTQVTAVTGQPVYLPTGASACASGTSPSCVGTANESRTVIAYDTDNLRVTSVTQRNGDNTVSSARAFTYDAVGNLLTIDGPLSGTADTFRYRYDSGRRRVGAIGPDPDGGGALHHRAQRITYANGRPTKQERGTVNSQSDGDWASFSSLEEVQQAYDSHGRPIVQRTVSGGTTYALTQTSYDLLGREQCVAQRMNPSEFASLPSDACTLDTQGSFGPDRIARSSYDAAGRVTLVETGYGVSGVAADEVTTSYRANGQIETVTDGNGNKTTYVYDGHDRLSRTRMPSPTTAGTSSTTDYEELTYATATVGGNSVSTPLVASRRLRDTRAIGLSYDALGRLTGKNLPGAELDVTYGYDLLGRLTSAATSAQTLGFTYDALGRQLTETGPVRTVSSAWDAAGRRQYVVADGHYAIRFAWLVTGELSALQNGNFDPVVTFAYDDLGRRTATAAFDGTASSRSYDAASRLTGLALDLPSSGNDVTFGYSYNPAGEIISNTRSNDAYSFTLANANVAGTANGLNQLTLVGGASVTHDDNGNVSAIGGAGYGYDSENRLVSAPGGTTLAYDPLGRLYSLSAGGTTRLFLYDGDTLFGEYATNGAPLMFYEHGPGVDEPVMWFDYSTFEFGTFHGDERGSVVASVAAGGTSINRYDDYGNPQGGSLTGRFGYTGQIWLPQAGLYHYRARAYNPAMGRFMQTDPIGFEGGMNLYAYVGNNPVNFTDPLGLQQTGNDVEVNGRRLCPRGTTQTLNGGCTQNNLDLLEALMDIVSGTSGGGLGHTHPDEGEENHPVVTGKRPPPPPDFDPPMARDLWVPASQGRSGPNRRRVRLTPEQRRDCSILLGAIAMGAVVVRYGAMESLIWATGSAAARGAGAGRLGGGWGMVIGGGIGALVALATYRASVDSRVAQFCAENMAE